jgi:hypothetical protein
MKAGNAIVKKCLVVLLTTLYLFIAVTYLLYLPKFSPLRVTSNYKQAKSQLIVNSLHEEKNTGANALVLIHRAHKSTMENKREMFSKLLQIGVIFVFIIVGGALSKQLTPLMAGVTKPHPQCTCLSYCTLRI